MNFRVWLEGKNDIWWHGSSNSFELFGYEHLATGRGTGTSGKGYDQEGPGFYFTSDESDARHYFSSGGQLLKAQLKLEKLVPLHGKPKKKEIEWLMRRSPVLDDALTDWDENPQRAFQDALKAVLNRPNPHDAFQTVWYDIYRGDSVSYLQNISQLYDGVTVPKADNIRHAIVFSPKNIIILDIER